MASDEGVQPHENRFRHFFEWVDSRLSPAFGDSPPVPYGDADRPIAESPCPLCGHVMAEHIVDHSTPNTVLICPTGERLPLRPDNGPLDELGMPASEDRLLRLAKRQGG